MKLCICNLRKKMSTTRCCNRLASTSFLQLPLASGVYFGGCLQSICSLVPQTEWPSIIHLQCKPCRSFHSLFVTIVQQSATSSASKQCAPPKTCLTPLFRVSDHPSTSSTLRMWNPSRPVSAGTRCGSAGATSPLQTPNSAAPNRRHGPALTQLTGGCTSLLIQKYPKMVI